MRRAARGNDPAARRRVALVATSCGGSSSSTSTTTSQPASGTAFAIPAPIVPFGLYLPVPLDEPDTPAYAGPSTPTSLANVDARALREGRAEAGSRARADAREAGLRRRPVGLEPLPVRVRGEHLRRLPGLRHDRRRLQQLGTWSSTRRCATSSRRCCCRSSSLLVASLVADAHAQALGLGNTPLAGSASRVEQLYEVAAAELGQKVALGPLARPRRR